jgi:hypothetical protein
MGSFKGEGKLELKSFGTLRTVPKTILFRKLFFQTSVLCAFNEVQGNVVDICVLCASSVDAIRPMREVKYQRIP